MTRRLRRFVWLTVAVLLLAGAYTGYWFWLARTFETNLALWVEQQRAMGYRISYTASESSGFPGSITIPLGAITAEPPSDQPQWRLTSTPMNAWISPWKPLRLNLAEVRTDTDDLAVKWRVEWKVGDRSLKLLLDAAAASIDLPMTGDLPAFDISAHHIAYQEDEKQFAWVLFPGMRIELHPSSSYREASVEFRFDAFSANIGPNKEVYSLKLRGSVMGPIPNGPVRPSLIEWSSQGGFLEVTQIGADWPSTGTNGSATVALDADLQPIVSGTALIPFPDKAVDALVKDGIVAADQSAALKFVLAAMTKPAEDGGPPAAKLPITIQDGFLFVGPLKLAQMPRIVWQ